MKESYVVVYNNEVDPVLRHIIMNTKFDKLEDIIANYYERFRQLPGDSFHQVNSYAEAEEFIEKEIYSHGRPHQSIE